MKNIKSAIYPKENERYILAVCIGVPVVILGVVLTIETIGNFILISGSLFLVLWFIGNITRAKLQGNSIKVSETNFPDIHSVRKDVQNELNYQKEIPIYILNEGGVNALIVRYFRSKYIILNSDLVHSMQDENILQMKWVIARFVGALKAKHFRFNLLQVLIDNFENTFILNVFILPYVRATQYTGDNIGLLICEDLDQVMKAFNKLMIGNELSEQIDFWGIIEQGRENENNIFLFLARLTSYHPHLVDRYINLLAFAQKTYPEKFFQYLTPFERDKYKNLKSLLPEYDYEEEFIF